MRATPSDTSAEAAAILLEGYRRMSPSQKLQRVIELNRAAEALASARLRARYGELDARTHLLRLAALRIPRELMIAACGWDPEREGY